MCHRFLANLLMFSPSYSNLLNSHGLIELPPIFKEWFLFSKQPSVDSTGNPWPGAKILSQYPCMIYFFDIFNTNF